jgi:eukaryotic-like serine/threonine-protein kinase
MRPRAVSSLRGYYAARDHVYPALLMTLPRLRADLPDGREIARVLRSALRHDMEFVPLSEPPTTAGQHLLEVEVPGTASVILLADPVGEATDDGYLLHVRPVTREQMATLLDLVERLDDGPSDSTPPEVYIDVDGQRTDSGSAPPPAEHTIVSPMMFDDQYDDGPALFGMIDSLVPASPPSSAASESVLPPKSSALPQHEMIGRIIAGKYEIESVIGSGASAAVYRAMHRDLRRAVAVKILHEQNRDDSQFVKRFKAEALAASKLEHPNVARVLDFGFEKDGNAYIVMELLTGRSLEAILAAEGRLASAVVTKIAIQTCSALAFAHDEGIIHRDVKPENIMLVPSRDDDGKPCDVVKVCDFGLAKLRDADPDQRDLTTAGMLCGSPAYMSPEQTRGDVLDARTDVYSLGVALFEALTGDLPHLAYSIPELFAKKVLEAPRKPTALVPSVDGELEKIVIRALSSDRESRHPTARAMRDDLRKVLARLETTSAN